jgi:outer membrane protein OmpA-like peptidoglycan-associated protein
MSIVVEQPRLRLCALFLFPLTLMFIGGFGIRHTHAQTTTDVSVDYSAIDDLDIYGPGEATVVIPPEGGRAPKLKPPRGVAPYTSAKVTKASLAPLLCPCAHKLVLKQPGKTKKKARHKKHAEIQHAAVTRAAPKTESAAPRTTVPKTTAHKTTASLEPPARAPAPKPVAAPSAKPAPVALSSNAPPSKVTAVHPTPTSLPAHTPAPAPTRAPVAVASMPSSTPATSAPTTTQWSKPGSDKARPGVLTPPPLPKPLESKTVEKTEAPRPPAAPTAAPPPAQVATAKPVDLTKPAQVAALSPSTAAAASPSPIAVSYEKGGSAVPEESMGTVKQVSAKLAADPSLRVQLLSYATDPEKNVSRARRLSLERAVAVRKVLIDNGLDSTRIEVRALGEQNTGGQPNRVDIVLVTRR